LVSDHIHTAGISPYLHGVQQVDNNGGGCHCVHMVDDNSHLPLPCGAVLSGVGDKVVEGFTMVSCLSILTIFLFLHLCGFCRAVNWPSLVVTQGDCGGSSIARVAVAAGMK
jgi:hypothetical protein